MAIKGNAAIERFIGEAVEPDAATFDTRGMAKGGPGLPRRFTWRGTTYEVAEVLRTWRETGPCTSGSPEQYVRKHWFEVRTATGEVMTLYFERQARNGRERKKRWWLFTIKKPHGW